MKLKHRAGLFVFGLFFCFYGIGIGHKFGVFPYLNVERQPVFPIAVIITGLFVCAAALLPSGNWVYRLFRYGTRREPDVLQKKNPYQH